jgi:hypothetical protein
MHAWSSFGQMLVESTFHEVVLLARFVHDFVDLSIRVGGRHVVRVGIASYWGVLQGH